MIPENINLATVRYKLAKKPGRGEYLASAQNLCDTYKTPKGTRIRTVTPLSQLDVLRTNPYTEDPVHSTGPVHSPGNGFLEIVSKISVYPW